MFDLNKTRDGFYIDTVGATGTNAAFFCSEKIPVLSETTYVFSKAVGQVAFYAFNGAFLSYLPGVKGGVSFATPTGACFLMFSQTLSTGKNAQMLIKGQVIAGTPLGILGFALVIAIVSAMIDDQLIERVNKLLGL